MTPKHTAGPFESHDTPNWYAFESRLYEVTDKNGLIVAFVKDWNDAPKESRENARLFAAAPELLEVLQEYDAALTNLDTECRESRASMRLVMIKARAAIAKATGEQPT